MRFVNVLVVNGEPFNLNSATGITMSNLFAGWPQECLGQVYTANIATEHMARGCNIKLCSNDLAPFSLFKGRLFAGNSPIPSSPKVSDIASPLALDKIRGHIRRIASPALDLLSYNIPAKDMESIYRFKPDVIYSMLGNIRMVRLVTKLSNCLNIPVVPHFMDDWISTYSVPGRSTGSPFHVWRLKGAVEKLFESAPIAMSIGEMMSEEYSKRFSRDFFDFMNPVDVDDNFPRADRKKQSNIVKFVYVGGLHLGRSDCLSDIAETVRELSSSGYPVELHIYTPASDSLAAQKLANIGPSIFYKGSIPASDVRSVLDQSDVAIHVESFAEDCAEYTRLSVSTKIPQYFAAGMPVLAYGPSSLASCHYVHSTGCGMHVGKRSRTAIKEAIKSLILNEQLRINLGYCAWQRAKEFHAARFVRQKFQNLLSLASKAGPVNVLHG